jgi:hypothetical protein
VAQPTGFDFRLHSRLKTNPKRQRGTPMRAILVSLASRLGIALVFSLFFPRLCGEVLGKDTRFREILRPDDSASVSAGSGGFLACPSQLFLAGVAPSA